LIGGDGLGQFPLVAPGAAKVVVSVVVFRVDFDSFGVGDDGIDGQAGEAV